MIYLFSLSIVEACNSLKYIYSVVFVTSKAHNTYNNLKIFYLRKSKHEIFH